MKAEDQSRETPDYLCYAFQTEGTDSHDFLIAHLSGIGFEAFEEKEGFLYAYLPETTAGNMIEAVIDNLPGGLFLSWEKERIESQNWNASWESSFSPIRIGQFCAVRASFHDPVPDVQHELVIDPKMAFGTGHHETTWMMISAMEKLEFLGKHVLDYGAGTGILSILAAQCGAIHVDALDNDIQALENIQLNLHLNKVNHIEAIQGQLDAVRQRQYDIILANINRNVILDSLAELYAMLVISGSILFSGILATDRDLVTHKIRETGFEVRSTWEKGEWLCLEAGK